MHHLIASAHESWKWPEEGDEEKFVCNNDSFAKKWEKVKVRHKYSCELIEKVFSSFYIKNERFKLENKILLFIHNRSWLKVDALITYCSMLSNSSVNYE